MNLTVTLAAAMLIGVTLGVLGGGGSILTVPILVYLAGLPVKEAIAMSLFIVGVTAAFAVIPHARAGRVRWRTGAIFGVAGMAGAYAGGRAAGYIPAAWLLIGFAVMMVATAAAMLRGRRARPDRPVPHELPIVHVLADGLVVGLVTGLVGAGGGFLVVPALVLLGGLPMTTAVGTSLLVIAMKSTAGLAGYLHTVDIDWGLTLAVTAAAVAGSVAGSRLAGRIGQDVLRKAFGWFVLAMAAFVLLQQAPATARHWLLATPAGWAALTAAAVAGAVTVGLLRHRRRATRPRSVRIAAPPVLVKTRHTPWGIGRKYGKMTREVSLTEFAAAHAGGAFVVDVREPYEYAEGHVPGARLVPMGRLAEVRPELSRTEPVYLICASGNRSLAAADFLAQAGIQSWSVAGGTGAWLRAGKPIVRGAHANAA